jgi:hypothetical protein
MGILHLSLKANVAYEALEGAGSDLLARRCP